MYNIHGCSWFKVGDDMRKFTNMSDTIKRVVQHASSTLNNAQDIASEKLNNVKKSKLGKQVTYLLGGNPNVDEAVELQKHDTIKNDNPEVLKRFDHLIDLLEEEQKRGDAEDDTKDV